MTWDPTKISDRRKRTDRDRRVDDHEVVRHAIASAWFAEMVEIFAEATPESPIGRPRRHAVHTVAFMYVLSLMMASHAEAENFLRYGNNWNSYRRLLEAKFPSEPLLRAGVPAPTRSVLRHAKKKLGEHEAQKIELVMTPMALRYATEMGIGINHGTMLMPSENAGMFGDGVVIRPMSKHKRGDMGFNQRTGRDQQRRYDPDATFYTDGTGSKVYGNHFVQMSACTEAPNEVITFAIHPLRKRGADTEASIALRIIKEVKDGLPGMAMVHYDKALRGQSVEKIWNMQLMPMIGVYDKTGLLTEQVPLGEKTVNGLAVNLFAYRGAVCIRGMDGEFIALTARKLSYIRNARLTYRAYCDYQVTEGSNCDTRLWGGTTQQRMNSPEKADFVYGEHIRAHAPNSPEWKALYGNRSLAESVNSWMKKKLGPGARARSLNQTHQWIDLMVMLMTRNEQSLLLCRRRTHRARSALPSAA